MRSLATVEIRRAALAAGCAGLLAALFFAAGPASLARGAGAGCAGAVCIFGRPDLLFERAEAVLA